MRLIGLSALLKSYAIWQQLVSLPAAININGALNGGQWVAVAGKFVPAWVYNIGTTVLNGGVSMVVFFFVNKIIFPETPKKDA